MKKERSFTLEEIKEKWYHLLYSNQQIVKAVVANPRENLDKKVPYLTGANLCIYSNGKQTMEYKNLKVELTNDDVVLTSSERDKLIKRAAAHMVAKRLNKFYGVNYKSVVWALLTTEEEIPEDWTTPIIAAKK